MAANRERREKWTTQHQEKGRTPVNRSYDPELQARALDRRTRLRRRGVVRHARMARLFSRSLPRTGREHRLAAISLAAAYRGSLRGRLVWVGSLSYFVYTYLEFAVSPPFTALYLLHVTAFGSAIPPPW